MRSVVETIWRVPAYLPYLQPLLTDEAIASAEIEIGYALPTEFLELLRKQNGGLIRLSLPDVPNDMIAGIGPYFPSLTDFDWNESQDYVSYPLEGLVPFDGDGHWHLCLDYRNNRANPSVTYIDVECDEQSEVATSFNEYLSLLRVDVRDDYVLECVPDVETVKSRLSSQLGITFDAPDSYAYGYTMHRAPLGATGSRQWLWLSPNTVPCGFVRPNDPRYEQLKDLMTGNAPRYPEVANDSFILQATDGFRDKVLDACAKANISIRPLRELVSAK